MTTPTAAPSNGAAPASPAPSAASPAPSPPVTAPRGPASGNPAPQSGNQAAVPGNQPAGDKPLTPAEERYFYERMVNGQPEKIDISDWKTKLKVDGREIETDLKSMMKRAQLERTSFKRIEEASKLKQQLAQQEQTIKKRMEALKNPEVLANYLQQNHPDFFAKAAENFITEQIRLQKLPPEVREREARISKQQREFERQKAELARERAAIEAEKKAQSVARGKAMLNKWKAEWPADFQRLGAPAGDAVNNELFEETVSILQRAHKLNIDLPISEAQKQAVERYRERVGATLRALPPEALRGLVGDEGLAKLAAVRDQAIDTQPGRVPPENQPAPGSVTDIRKRRRLDDY